MKKKYLVVGSLAFFSYFAKAQQRKDTTKVKQTDIELVYNHYLQDGNNSAVTGGVGTEKLTVYGPAVNINTSTEGHALSINAGADVISSASTDKIDNIPSSASIVDLRYYLKGNYSKQFEDNNLSVNGGLSVSIESDYFSKGAHLGFTKTDKNELRTFSFDFQLYNDDLRWGRLNPGYHRPVKLIYPSELRNREWYDETKRNSYNFKFGLIQVINKRNVLALYPELTYQKGLLSTPFHRVYFSNDSVVVENLPNKRLKKALALKLNTFVGGNVILKNMVSGYEDDFGIMAIALENETAVKITPSFTVLPSVRLYMQKASEYFAPYQQHESGERYYTSDYDLSKFKTYALGLGIKLSPHKYWTKGKQLSTIILRYTYIHRTTNLNAHAIGLVIRTESVKKQHPKK